MDKKDQSNKDQSNVVSLRAKTRQLELERLNRLTGLSFGEVPQSLVSTDGGLELAVDDGEELIHRALYLWGEAEQT